jgi:tetratricopeptide (TPR) repeat protein
MLAMKSKRGMTLATLRMAVLASSLAISLATAVLPGAAAYAQTAPWDAPALTAEPAAMLAFASHLKAERYAPVTLFLEESHYSFDSANRCRFARHVVYRVETQDAVQHWSSVSAQWSPWRQKRPVIRARVILPDGTVHTLDPNVLSEAPAHDQRPEIYEDKRVYSGPLPAVAAGSIVEWEIVSEDTAPLFEGGVLWRAHFGRSVPMLHGVLVIEAPKNTPLRYVTHLLPNVKVNKIEKGDSVTVTFDQGPMPAIEKPEPFTPSNVPTWPAVEFSTGTSWQAVAGAYQREIESAIKPQDVSELVKGSAGLTRQALILHLVNNLHRNVRYTGLEFGASGLIPHPAGETVARGYGDCKDKAVVLVSLLRAAGIPANLALLATRERDDISPELAGIGSFDHAIVYVPGEPGTWIDATAEFSQPGVLPWAAQGRLALIIGPTTGTLVRTPVAKPADNLLVEKREFHLSEYGPARIVETSKPKGDIESRYRAYFGGQESKKTNEEIENYVKANYLAESLTHFEHTPGDDLEHPFEMSMEVARGKRGYSSLQDAVVAIPFASMIVRYPRFVYAEDDSKEPNNANKHVRKQDVEMPPFITEWQYKIIPPPGFGPPTMPQDREVKLGPAVLTQKYRTESDGSASVVFRFDSGKARYSLEELKALRQALNATSADAVIIRFPQTGAAQLAAGNVREALATYQALIKQHPAESIHHLQFANALMVAGFGDQARAEANKAVTLDPASATAYAVLGWILEHDAIGREFGKGFDLQGAVAAYRKSLQLDPKEWSTHAELAILLEYDADGARYSARAPLKEAVDEYRALKELDRSDGAKYDDNLLFALFYSRQWKEVGEVYAGLSSTPTRQAIAIAATAARDGSEAALAESARLGLSESDRSKVLVEAANLLVRLRMYPRTLDLLNAAASSQQDSAQLRRRIEVLSAVRPYQETLLPESDPRGVVQKMFVWTWAPHSKPDELVQLMEFDEADRKDEVQAAVQQARRSRSAWEKQGTAGNVSTDIVVSNLKMTTEGNDASGYRIRVFGMSEKPQVALVARRPAGYRIVAFGGDLKMVGPEVLRRLEAHDLKGAKQWLDWAREEQALQGGDDPLAGPVFPRFWARGDDPDPGKMKLAAIALMANSSAVRGHVEDLRAARAKAPEGDQTKLDLALMVTSFKLENWALLRESAGRLLAAYPNSDTAFAFMTIACRGQQDWTGWEKAVAARQARLPDDLTAVRSAASLADASGDFVKARSILRGLIDSGRAELGDVNNYSWYALFTGKVSDEDVRVLEHSIAARTTDPGFDSLHTLACLYAQVGKGKEARELLLKAMDSAGYEEPDSAIWLGFGSIAEQYGLPDTALADYRRVQKPEGFMYPSSNYQLAHRNMQHLAGSQSQTTIAAKRRLP